MAGFCSQKRPSTNYEKALFKVVGNSSTEYNKLIAHTITDGEFSSSFIEAYMSEYPNDEKPSVFDENLDKVAEFARHYILRNLGDSRKTIKNRTSLVNNNFATPDGYNKSFRYVANEARDILRFTKIRIEQGEKIKITPNLIKKQVVNRFRNIIRDRICSLNNKSQKEVVTAINNARAAGKNQIVTLREMLGGTNISTANANVLAIYISLVNPATSNAYFDRVFKSEGLTELDSRTERTTNEDVTTEVYSVEHGEDFDDDTVFEETDELNQVSRYDHSGLFSSHLKHFDSKINDYFNSLQKLRSKETDDNGNYVDFDTDNEFGLIDCMSAKTCIGVLKSIGTFDSVPTLIDSVKRIADTVPGFKAFHRFAKDLTDDSDFATKILNTFAKPIYIKTIDHVGDKTFYTEISNERSIREIVLRYDFINSSKSNITGNDFNYTKLTFDKFLKTFDKFQKRVKDYYSKDKDFDKYKEDRTTTISELFNVLKFIYPNLEASSIENYVINNPNNATNVPSIELKNLEDLVSDVTKLIKESDEVVTKFEQKRKRLKDANITNNRLQQLLDEDQSVDRKKFIDVEAIISEDYVTPKFNEINNSLAIKLAPYSVVEVELTSSNAARNNSSNMINASYLSNLQDMLNSKDKSILTNFGEYKLQSRQYDLSPIMLEHSENGVVINPGLFKWNGSKYVPTDYASELLEIELFDGTRNEDTSEGVMYPNLLGNDYLVLQYDSYHKNKKTFSDKNYGMSSYFLRTPSDAPKNFRMHLPSYDTKGLIITNEDGTRTINKNHRVFKILMNIAQQEFDDMAHGIDVIFEHNNGVVAPQQGEIRYNVKLDDYRDKKGVLIKNYHYRDNIVEKIKEDENGRVRLTGRLFKSEMFSVTSNGVHTNFMDEVLVDIPTEDEGTISLLYGGANNTHLHISNGKAVLTEAQRNKVQDAISKWILAYSNDTLSKINEASNYITTDINNDNVLDYAINYFIAYKSFDDILEGDTKMYKSGQDVLKRAKEVQGSGVPYRFVPKSHPFGQAPIVMTKENCGFTPQLNTESIQNLLNGWNKPILQRTAFRGVTILGTTTNNTELKATLKNDLIKNCKVDETTAETIADNYVKVKANDAQSYITFEEWVRRIAGRGQLTEYLPVIQDVMEHKKNPSHKLSAYTINKFVQIQKNFYYDQYFDETTGTMMGRQIKNAELVLVPGMIDGTELQKVYDLMVKYDIDQLNTSETSKAGTQKELVLFDSTGHLTDENIADFESHVQDAEHSYIQNFDYRNLFTQQETPQHMNADNKIGIQLWKKIMDNLETEDNIKRKEDLFNLIDENIYESFGWMMDELGVERDPNGGMRFDDEGNPEGLNVGVFLDKMKQELLRFDVTENEMEFVTLDSRLNRPIMPFYASYRAKKFEQVSQSIFNNITRQKLPGFHAVQTTGIGWSRWKEYADAINANIPDVQLQYHPNGERVIEVLVPKSMFGFAKDKNGNYLYDDETLLKQLQDENEHLDEIIGYRIPTEGKQSMGILRIKGFIDDAFGSTIVMPDGWVAQTGSDFDVDSVYGIQHSTYTDMNGVIHKVKYRHDFNEIDYFNYINHRVEREDRTKFGKELAKAKEEIKAIITNAFDEHLVKEGEAYHALPEAIRNNIKAIIEDVHNSAEYKNKNQQNGFVYQLEYIADELLAYVDKHSNVISVENELKIKDYCSYAIKLANYIKDQNADIYEIKKNSYEEVILSNKEKIEGIAKKYGLPSYEEYLALPDHKKNSRSARNTRICDNILSILKTDEVQGEIVSGSTFRDAVGARDELSSSNNAKTVELKNRSPYNPIDQAKYQAESMAFAQLKGVSVTLDNFCSVCNNVRPNIIDKFAIKVKYSDGTTTKHNTYGWSSNHNRNKEGKLITAYSSQTTAHILDAIKEGGIPNVNNYTFGVYKNFVSMGSTYRLATAFMMQPAIERIVNAHARTNSVFADTSYSNPIMDAIRELVNSQIPDEKKHFSQFASNDSIYAYLDNNGFTNEIANILGVNIDSIKDLVFGDESITLDEAKLVDIAKNPNKTNVYFDLAMCFAFNRFKQFSDKITAISLVSNPDKFGAKQTIYSTQKVFNDISKLNSEKECPLFVGDKTFIQSLYPNVSDDVRAFAESDDAESSYPSMYFYLKRAAASSILVNRSLFDTQNVQFRRIIESFGQYKPNGYENISEEEYVSVSDFILSSMKNETRFITSKVEWDYDNKKIVLKAKEEFPANLEFTRIFGYGYPSSLDATEFEERENGFVGIPKKFMVEDLNNPTEDEIKSFTSLSPAQKVMFIQRNFADALVCKYFKVSLFHSKNSPYSGQQTINYVSDNVSNELVINEFLDTYYNDNPLLQLTAIDVIKYATVVENAKIRKNGTSIVVPNLPLRTTAEEGGLSFIAEMDTKFKNLYNYSIDDIRDYTEMLVTRYVRSHPESDFVKKVNYKKLVNLGIVSQQGVRIFQKGVNDDALVSGGIIYITGNVGDETQYAANSFVKVKYKNDVSILYKVVEKDTAYYMYPLNPLSSQETTEYSVKGRTYNSEAFYDTYISQFDSMLSDEEEPKNITPSVVEDIKNNKDNPYRYQQVVVAKGKTENLYFDINSDEFKQVKDQIIEHYSGPTAEPLVINNLKLASKLIYPKKGVKVDSPIQPINGVLYSFKRVNTDELRRYTATTRDAAGNIIPNPTPILQKHKKYKKFIDAARDRNGHVTDLVEIKPAVIKYSSAGEYVGNPGSASPIGNLFDTAQESIRLEARINDNAQAKEAVRLLNSNYKQIDCVDDVSVTTTSIVSRYVAAKVEDLLNGNHSLNNFVEVNGEWLSFDDDRVFKMIVTNTPLREEWIKTVSEARKIISDYDIFGADTYEIKEPLVAASIERINKNVKRLKDNKPLNNAEILFVNKYLDKIAKNPNSKLNLVSVGDGYHSTGFIESAINDLQDTGNPTVQVLLKDILSYISARDIEAKDRRKEYERKLAEIKKEGTIDYNKIIDEDGNLRKAYNEKLTTDYRSLLNKMNEEFAKKPGSIEHLKAKLEFDKFMFTHFEREVDNSYYEKRIKLEEQMLNLHPTLYSEYRQKSYRLQELINQSKDGTNPDLDKKINNLNRELENMTSNTEINEYGYFAVKSAEGQYNAKVLKDYRKTLASIEETYYEQKEDDTFYDTLKKQLAYVVKAERAATTFGYVNQGELDSDDRYREAKQWIVEHAHFEYDLYKVDETSAEFKEAVKELSDPNYQIPDNLKDVNANVYIAAAQHILRKERGTVYDKNSIYKRILKQKGAYDAQHRPDASKLSDDDIKVIKDEQERRFNISAHHNAAFIDKNILHTAVNDDTIYSKEWYDSLKPSGITNPMYLENVRKLNAVLRKGYNPRTRTLDTTQLSIDELNDAVELMKLFGYNEESQKFGRGGVKHYLGGNNEIIKFIKKNGETTYGEDAGEDTDRSKFGAEFNAQYEAAKRQGVEYFNAWHKLNMEYDKSKKDFVPNRLLWGTIRPKKEVRDKYVNHAATNANRINNLAFKHKPTPAYYDKWYEMTQKSVDEFNAWYEANHIYNPNTYTYEPLICWTYYEPSEELTGTWKANKKYTTRSLRKDKDNSEYVPNVGTFGNYKKGSGYDNEIILNDAEQKVKKEIQKVLNEAYKTEKYKSKALRGELPKKALTKYGLAEIGKDGASALFGIPDLKNTNADWREDNEMDYEHDIPTDMPLTNPLIIADFEEKIRNLKAPDREEGETEDAYRIRVAEYNKQKQELYDEYRTARQDILDKNWEEIIPNFIELSAKYNAIQDVKNLFYFGQKVLKNTPIIQKRNNKIKNLQAKDITSTPENPNYVAVEDSRLISQYNNYGKRLIYDQWKENPNGMMTKAMKLLQGMTSTKYMAMNIRGGIANVTLGRTQILMEQLAEEYFGNKDWYAGINMWRQGLIDYMANAFNETSSSLSGAIVKYFKVVDYDEVAGFGTANGLKELNNKFKSFLFTPQTSGEHFMQNSALFAMMHSHRVIRTSGDDESSIRIMNQEEYIRERTLNDLSSILTDKQFESFNKFREELKKDRSILEDYARMRKDVITEWVINNLDAEQTKEFNRNQIKEFNKLRNEKRKEYIKDFEKAPRLETQFKFDNGKLGFADESILLEKTAPEKDKRIADTYLALGEFKERVISVNKKIHGVYDKLGSAQIEKYWWGSILMQYHKHLVPNIIKRYRRQGTFNEIRGTVEKGSFVSLIDFLKLNYRAVKAEQGLTNEQEQAIKATQNILSTALEFVSHMRLTWNTMSQSERANMKRNLGDLYGCIFAIGCAILLKLGWDDDENDMYNLLMYEADRLATETAMYSIGAATEFKTLWSSPVAIQQQLDDAMNLIFEVPSLLLNTKFDDVYKSGQYAGEHKWAVKLRRNIPIYRQYESIFNLKKNNKYYRRGENMLGFINLNELGE